MMLKPLLLLAALTLCCCITSLHGCKCMQTIHQRIPVKAMKKIEMIPISGQCRWTEIIVTMRTNKGVTRVCVDPSAQWVKTLLTDLQGKAEDRNETTPLQTASTTTSNF